MSQAVAERFAVLPLRADQLSLYLELTKPRLSLLVLTTTAAGFWMGTEGLLSWGRFLRTLLGTVLVVGGANALNEWMERDADALMRRTQRRPLPAGRLSPEAARRFGWALIAGGVLWLGAAVGILSAALASLAAVSYLDAYTPMKRSTPLCTLVGAIPGALPPMIGWAAARGVVSREAWALFALLFVWQLPHFLAIAVLYREDYLRAKFRMLPVTELHGAATARYTALYGLVLVPVSVFPAVIGMSGVVYGIGALCLSLIFLTLSVRSALARSTLSCRHLFLASVCYLPLLLILLVLDKCSR